MENLRCSKMMGRRLSVNQLVSPLIWRILTTEECGGSKVIPKFDEMIQDLDPFFWIPAYSKIINEQQLDPYVVPDSLAVLLCRFYVFSCISHIKKDLSKSALSNLFCLKWTRNNFLQYVIIIRIRFSLCCQIWRSFLTAWWKEDRHIICRWRSTVGFWRNSNKSYQFLATSSFLLLWLSISRFCNWIYKNSLLFVLLI